MKNIFISHRSVDAQIVDEIIQYLENIGIERDEIMYTSADSTGIQYDLGKEIKEAIVSAKIFIVVLSTEYFESPYCCNELGYIWATEKNPIVFGLSGIDSEKDFQGFINHGWKIRRINNPSHIDFLFQEVIGFSKKTFTSPVKPNEYKELFIKKVNALLGSNPCSRRTNEKNIYKPDKIIDIDTLIANGYYSNKELMLFRYVYDTNKYIWGTASNLRSYIKEWEKNNRFTPFLSDDLEPFLIMLFRKGYLSNKIIKDKEFAVADCIGKSDDHSKTMRALFNVDEEGYAEYNYFTMDERLFRVIIGVDKSSLEIMDKACNKYKLKWYQFYTKEKK